MMNKHAKHIIYVSPQIYAYAEIAYQTFCLRNLFSDENKYQISLITFPIQKFKMNKALYNITTRGINVVQTTDHNLIWYSSKTEKKSVIQEGNNIYLLCNNNELYLNFFKSFQNRQRVYFPSLNKRELEKGKKIRKSFGIPEHAPIVTLHVRESGWTGGKKNDGPSIHRNAQIKNYYLAIKYLIEEGFYVVRLGDTSMKKLELIDPHVIDAPFHPNYSDIVDPYFISQSTFFIGVASGPYTIAECFGTPKLMTNYPISDYTCAWKKDLFIFKKYYSEHLKRYLTYDEILTSQASSLAHTESLEKEGLKLVENTSEEILAAVKEMDDRLNDNYSSKEEMKQINSHFLSIQKKALCLDKHLNNSFTYVPLYHFFDHENVNVPISIEYLKANPFFMGHLWK